MNMKTIRRAPAPRALPPPCVPDATKKASPSQTLCGCRNLLYREEGQNLVEFAFVAPMLLLAVTGLLWFGIALNQYEVLTNAVANGARAFALARGGPNASDPCSYAYGVTTGAASTLTATNITFKVIYTPYGGSAASYTTTCSSLTLQPGDTVQVTATYPVNTQIFSWGNKSVTLNAQTSELVQ